MFGRKGEEGVTMPLPYRTQSRMFLSLFCFLFLWQLGVGFGEKGKGEVC